MNKKKSANFVNARLLHILERPPPDYPTALPDHRGQIIIKNFDFGESETVIDLFKTSNITQYRVEINGVLWSSKAGMNKIHAEIRRINPPVLSPNSF